MAGPESMIEVGMIGFGECIKNYRTKKQYRNDNLTTLSFDLPKGRMPSILKKNRP